MTFLCQCCAARAMVICLGSDEVRAEVGILLRAAIPDRLYCHACAVAAGWPWLTSERSPRAARPPRQPQRRRGELFAAGDVLGERR